MKINPIGVVLLGLASTLPAESRFRDFIRVQGDQLVEEGKPFRFISWNIPNLHLVEDYVPFEPGDPSTAFECGSTQWQSR